MGEYAAMGKRHGTGEVPVELNLGKRAMMWADNPLAKQC
jgi:hypothetical protein